MNLITIGLAAAHAPLVGITRRNSRTLHAIALHDLIHDMAPTWPDTRRVTAACGASVKILNPLSWWAPRIRGTSLTRCPDCVSLHGARTRRPPRWARNTP